MIKAVKTTDESSFRVPSPLFNPGKDGLKTTFLKAEARMMVDADTGEPVLSPSGNKIYFVALIFDGIEETLSVGKQLTTQFGYDSLSEDAKTVSLKPKGSFNEKLHEVITNMTGDRTTITVADAITNELRNRKIKITSRIFFQDFLVANADGTKNTIRKAVSVKDIDLIE